MNLALLLLGTGFFSGARDPTRTAAITSAPAPLALGILGAARTFVPANETLAITLDGVTVAATQTAQHQQALAITLDDVSAAGSETETHDQTLDATLEDISVAIAQTGAVTGPAFGSGPFGSLLGLKGKRKNKKDEDEESAYIQTYITVPEKVQPTGKRKARLAIAARKQEDEEDEDLAVLLLSELF